MGWKIIIVEPVLSWLHELRRTDRATLEQISAAISAVESDGPALGRPLVDTVKGSSLPNLKELRPGSTARTEVRMLFVFDPRRDAVFLVGGDKSGNWSNWHKTAVPMAERAFADHLKRIEGKDDQR